MSRRTPRTVRTTIAGIAGGLVTSLVVLARDRCTRQRRQRRDPRQLHRLRLRPVPGPEQSTMNRWLQVLPVPRRRHLHLRRLARLPHPAEPHAGLGPHPADQGLATAADHARPAGVVPAALPALRRRRDDQPEAGQQGRYSAGPQAGPRRGQRRPWRAARTLGIVAGQHALVRPRGLRPRQHRLPRVGPGFLSAWTTQLHALGYVSGVYSSAGSGIKMLDDARVDRPDDFDLPDQIWMARWDGVANTSTSYIRDDGWHPHAPGQAVPGRPRRDLGRRTDQHRPQLPRPRPGLGRRRPRRTAAASPSATDLRAAQAADREGPPTPPRSRRSSACSRSRACTPARSTARYTPATSPPPTPGRPSTASRPATSGPSRTGCRCSSTASSRSLKFGSSGGAVRRVQRALNAVTGPGSRSKCERRLRRPHDHGAARPTSSASASSVTGVAGGPNLEAALQSPASAGARDGRGAILSHRGRSDEQRDAGQRDDRHDARQGAARRVAQQPGDRPVESSPGRRRAGATCGRAHRASRRTGRRPGWRTAGSTPARPSSRRPADHRWSTATSTVVRQ